MTVNQKQEKAAAAAVAAAAVVVEEPAKKPMEPTVQEVASLQQEENVSISGSNARLMIMKKLSRKAQVGEEGREKERGRERERKRGEGSVL